MKARINTAWRSAGKWLTEAKYSRTVLEHLSPLRLAMMRVLLRRVLLWLWVLVGDEGRVWPLGGPNGSSFVPLPRVALPPSLCSSLLPMMARPLSSRCSWPLCLGPAPLGVIPFLMVMVPDECRLAFQADPTGSLVVLLRLTVL